MPVDVIIKNCKLVKPEVILRAGVAIDDGKIVAIAKDSNLPNADKIIDADGKYVIPGVIEPHSHLNGGPEAPDIIEAQRKNSMTETQSAAAGGITTIMTTIFTPRDQKNIPLPYKVFFDDTKKTYEERSMIDFVFCGNTQSDEHIEHILECARDLGITNWKFYMVYKGPGRKPVGVSHSDDGVLYKAFEKVREIGYPGVAMIHAENEDIFFELKKRLVAQGRQDLAAWTESRPAFCEEEAIRRGIFIAKIAGVPLYIVHISSDRGVHAIADAKASGVNVWGETCPHYLTHTKDDERIGLLGKVAPPLRDKESIQMLWWGLQKGVIDTIGSDHCVVHKKEKEDIWDGRPGFPGTGTLLPVMLSEGVNKGRISLQKLVEVCSYNTARIFGLYPKKGTISVGSDGDLVVIDLDKKILVTPEVTHSRSDFTIYDGWELKGWPVLTMLRGNTVVEEGEIVGKPGTGEYIFRKTAT